MSVDGPRRSRKKPETHVKRLAKTKHKKQDNNKEETVDKCPKLDSSNTYSDQMDSFKRWYTSLAYGYLISYLNWDNSLISQNSNLLNDLADLIYETMFTHLINNELDFQNIQNMFLMRVNKLIKIQAKLNNRVK